MKRNVVVVLVMLSIAACADRDKIPTSPSNGGIDPKTGAINFGGIAVVPGANGMYEVSVWGNPLFLTDRTTDMRGRPLDINGANLYLMEYSHGVRRTFITGYANSAPRDLSDTTLFRDIPMNGKVDFSLALMPYTPQGQPISRDDLIPFTYRDKDRMVLQPGGMKLEKVGDEVRIQGSLPSR
jgi:hypothetical protein